MIQSLDPSVCEFWQNTMILLEHDRMRSLFGATILGHLLMSVSHGEAVMRHLIVSFLGSDEAQDFLPC
jgi:hypothetical protein